VDSNWSANISFLSQFSNILMNSIIFLSEMKQKYDVIVLGVGTMGASACAYLAAAGVKVLGLDQASIPNDVSSHSGYTRIIRKAYYEHPDYVPLLQKSYTLWNALEHQVHKKLYHETGILYLGLPDSPILNGCVQSSKLYDIPVENWTNKKTNTRFPQFKYPQDWMALWEPHAGYLDVNESIKSMLNVARSSTAEIHDNEKAIRWDRSDIGIEVVTDKGAYRAEKLIITAGPWTSQLCSMYHLPLNVTRQSLTWVDTHSRSEYRHPAFPCWFIHDPKKGMYYGFPEAEINDSRAPQGIKFGLHAPGMPADPDYLNRDDLPIDIAEADHFIDHYMPALQSSSRSYAKCMYTYTPDENFVLDYLPQTDKKVMMACGFSGHGFKFAPVIGSLLADMTMGNTIDLNFDFLRLNRLK
jgi:sarcosine oxidase